MNGKQLRNSILQWAISGRLVPQDPDDEPASALLKRINPKATPITEDAPFALPNSWCWVRGKQIFVPMESTKPRGDFKYVDVDAVNNKTNQIEKPKSLSKANAPSRATRKLHSNDVLFSMVRPYLRNIALVTEEYKDAIASSGFYVLTPSKVLYPKYLFYLVLSNYVVDGLNAFMKGDNSPSINNKHIEEYSFPLPPLAEQQRIVSKVEELLPLVERYDKAQTSLDQLNASLKGKLRASVLQEAISGRLVPQDPNDEPASLLLKRINPKAMPITEEVPFYVSDNWCWCRLGDIFEHNTGKALNNSGHLRKGVELNLNKSKKTLPLR